MTRYSPEFKEQVVRKMMPPHNQSVASLHRETGVSVPSLYAWKRHFQGKGYVVPAKISPPDGWDSKAKLAAVIETALMNEAERSAWCRERGGHERADTGRQGARQRLRHPRQPDHHRLPVVRQAQALATQSMADADGGMIRPLPHGSRRSLMFTMTRNLPGPDLHGNRT